MRAALATARPRRPAGTARVRRICTLPAATRPTASRLRGAPVSASTPRVHHRRHGKRQSCDWFTILAPSCKGARFRGLRPSGLPSPGGPCSLSNPRRARLRCRTLGCPGDSAQKKRHERSTPYPCMHPSVVVAVETIVIVHVVIPIIIVRTCIATWLITTAVLRNAQGFLQGHMVLRLIVW